MKTTDYSVLIIWSEEDEAFLAQILELPGCVADGATREEALANVTIAAQNWIDTAKEIGREIPKPVPFERFERPVNSEAQLQRAVEIELVKIIPELVKRLEAGIWHQAFRGVQLTPRTAQLRALSAWWGSQYQRQPESEDTKTLLLEIARRLEPVKTSDVDVDE